MTQALPAEDCPTSHGWPGRWVGKSASRHGWAACITLLMWLLLGPAGLVAAEPDTRSTSDRIEQARHYYKKGLMKEARKEIRSLLATEAGREDVGAQLLAAQIYRDSGEIDLAFRALSKARGSGNAAERASADEIYRALTRSYGEVRILPPGGLHVKGRIFLDTDEDFINVQRKKLFKTAQQGLLLKARSYPDSIWIPFGEYRANGTAFKHEQGGRTEVIVPFPRIVIIRGAARTEDNPAIAAFRQRVGGVSEVETLETNPEKGRLLVDKVRKLKPTLLIALGNEAALFCRREFRTTPMLFGLLEGPWQQLQLRNGGNATGVDLYAPPTAVVEKLVRVAPGIRRVGILHDPAVSAAQAKEVRTALEGAKLKAVLAEVSGPPVLAGTLTTHRDRVDAWWVLPHPVLLEPDCQTRLIQEQLSSGKALIVPSGALVARGAFMAVEGDHKATGIQLANLARQVLFQNAVPSELEVQTAEQRSWHLNLAAARKLGLEPSQELLGEIDRLEERSPAMDP